MSDMDRLVRAMAYDRAFAVANNCTCHVCGNPATRVFSGCNVYICDEHFPLSEAAREKIGMPPEYVQQTDELKASKAVRRLMKIANGEP